VAKRIRSDIAPKFAVDAAYRNARRITYDQALAKVMQHLLKDDRQVYKQFRGERVAVFERADAGGRRTRRRMTSVVTLTLVSPWRPFRGFRQQIWSR
jgi:hypothetical protein